MGDICNMNDVDRFLRSPEGKAHLEEIRAMLKRRMILDVTFDNDVHRVSTTLHLDNGDGGDAGDTFIMFEPSLEVDALREEFGEVLSREYYIDYPERKAQEHGVRAHS